MYVNDKYFTNIVILLFNINIIILKIKSLKYFFNHKKIEYIKIYYILEKIKNKNNFINFYVILKKK